MEWRCRVGMFTRSKDLGECHLVFTAFLTSAWRGGGGGMKVEVGGGGESGREKDVMTPTTTTSEAQSGCDRGAGRSLVSSVCCKHEPAGSG